MHDGSLETRFSTCTSMLTLSGMGLMSKAGNTTCEMPLANNACLLCARKAIAEWKRRGARSRAAIATVCKSRVFLPGWYSKCAEVSLGKCVCFQRQTRWNGTQQVFTHAHSGNLHVNFAYPDFSTLLGGVLAFYGTGARIGARHHGEKLAGRRRTRRTSGPKLMGKE